MKVIYLYDTTTNEYKGPKLVDDDYVVKNGETEIKPADGLYSPVTWNGTTWVGTDKEVWQAEQDAKLKEHPELAPKPTAEQQQLSNLIKSNTQQIALNAQLIKQITALQTAKADTTQGAE